MFAPSRIVFVLRTRDFDRQAFARATERQIGDAPPRLFPTTSAEDMVLHKLEWYGLGNEIAQRQWDDVLGVLRLQGSALDRTYLERWSRELGVEDLLARALAEAGLG